MIIYNKSNSDFPLSLTPTIESMLRDCSDRCSPVYLWVGSPKQDSASHVLQQCLLHTQPGADAAPEL